jgi:hypothetical protein
VKPPIILRHIAATACLAVLAVSAQSAEAPLVFEWRPGADTIAEGWRPLTFKNIDRHTQYTLLREGSGHVVKAQAEASASGLIHRLDVDAKSYPVLRWRCRQDRRHAQGRR